MTVAYILSPSYSGSTLLTFLLAAHRGIVTVGELKGTAMGDIDLYNCSCGRRISSCYFWRKLVEKLAQRGIQLELNNFSTHFCCPERPFLDKILRARVRGPLFETARALALQLLPGAQEKYRSILERNKTFIEVLTQSKETRVFLDGSKDPIRLQFLLNAGYWSVKVIYLIRDGRGAATSYMKHHAVSMKVSANEWRRTHEECDKLMKRLPGSAGMKIHYEDLCRNPEQILSDLFQFLELDPSQTTRDFRSVEQHILGNSMRLNTASEITLDEKWRATLKSEDLATFERIAGTLNRKYGYTE